METGDSGPQTPNRVQRLRFHFVTIASVQIEALGRYLRILITLLPYPTRMAEQRHLSQAPIREAILDLRFPPAASVDLGDLRRTLEELDRFEQIDEIRTGSATFHFSVEEGAQGQIEQSAPIGYRGTSEDGRWVSQFRIDGLTLSRLAPYADWEELSETGLRYSEALLGLARPIRVDRVALRYVNHFRIPHPARLEDYFFGLPSPPPELPQHLTNLLSRVTLHDPSRDFTAHIVHSLAEDLDPERIGFILDIDAFRTADFPTDTNVLWETFRSLRVFKNEIFFGLITETNAELHA